MYKKNPTMVKYFVRQHLPFISDEDYEFSPQDMLPYYDIYDNGDVIFYLSINGKIKKVLDNCIEVIEKEEIPTRIECNG